MDESELTDVDDYCKKNGFGGDSDSSVTDVSSPEKHPNNKNNIGEVDSQGLEETQMPDHEPMQKTTGSDSSPITNVSIPYEQYSQMSDQLDETQMPESDYLQMSEQLDETQM
eukprot:828601_1